MKKKARSQKVLEFIADTNKRKDINALAKICNVTIEEIAELIHVSPDDIRKNITAAGKHNKQIAIVYAIIKLSKIFVFNYSMLAPKGFDYAAHALAQAWAGSCYLKHNKSGSYNVIDYKDGNEIITIE
ncbi:MAG: hypothetical protein VZS12_09150 [Ruminococcus bromii]|nr:hypothetical protein [Ruminococcus bromii]